MLYFVITPCMKQIELVGIRSALRTVLLAGNENGRSSAVDVSSFVNRISLSRPSGELPRIFVKSGLLVSMVVKGRMPVGKDRNSEHHVFSDLFTILPNRAHLFFSSGTMNENLSDACMGEDVHLTVPFFLRKNRRFFQCRIKQRDRFELQLHDITRRSQCITTSVIKCSCNNVVLPNMLLVLLVDGISKYRNNAAKPTRITKFALRLGCRKD